MDRGSPARTEVKSTRSLVIFRRIHIEIQAGILRFKQSGFGGLRLEESPQVRGGVISKGVENRCREEDWMSGPAAAGGLANLRSVGACEFEQGAQRVLSKVRLIPQDDDPVCEAFIPSFPGGGALN